MQCPYCAEEIKDEANFCRHCGHDLSFFKLIKPMLEKISSLEDQISKISAALDALHAGDQIPVAAPHSKRKSSLPFWQYILVVALPAVVTIIALNMSVAGSTDWWDVLLIVSLLSSGLWAGINQREKYLRHYILLGILIGIPAGTGSLLFESVERPDLYKRLLDGGLHAFIAFSGFYLAFVTLISTTLFLSGALFGIIVKRRRFHTTASEAPTTEKMVKKFVSPDNRSFDRVLGFLTFFYPSTLAFIGSLLTIYKPV